MLLGPRRIAVNAQLLQPGITLVIRMGNTWQTTHAVLREEQSEVFPRIWWQYFVFADYYYFFCKHSYSNNITGGTTTNRQHDHDNVVRSFLSCFRTEKVPWMMSSDLLTSNHFRTFSIHICPICCLAKKCPTQRTLGPLNNNNNKRTITKAKWNSKFIHQKSNKRHSTDKNTLEVQWLLSI